MCTSLWHVIILIIGSLPYGTTTVVPVARYRRQFQVFLILMLPYHS